MAAGTSVAGRAPENGVEQAEVLRLDERQVVELAIRNTLAVRIGLLQREGERFAFRVARQRFQPKVDLTASAGRTRRFAQAEDTDPLRQDDSKVSSFGPQLAWRLPTGAEIASSWTNQLNSNRALVTHLLGDRSATTETGWTVSFAQPLLRGGGWTVGRADLTSAEIAEQVSRLNLRNVTIGAVNEALSSFRGYIQARDAAAISKLSLERGRQTLDTSRSLLEAGRVSPSEVTQAEADVASRQLAHLAALNAEDAARLALANLVGLSSGSKIEAQLPTIVARKQVGIQEALEVAYRNRTDWAAANLDGKAAKLGLVVAKNAQLWDLRFAVTRSEGSLHNATSSYRTALGGLARPDKGETFVGLTMSVPVWGNLERRQQLLSAQLALRNHELRQEQLKNDVLTQVTDRVRNLDTAWQSLLLARASRELAARAVEDENVRFRSGLSSTMNVTRLEDALVVAQNSELGATLNYLSAITSLDVTLGSLLEAWSIKVDFERGELSQLSP